MQKLLLIGDSITEDGRFNDDNGIGVGYVSYIQKQLQAKLIDVEVINKGISGNRIIDLENRWQTDVINEQPDYLSISIGINDVWRQLDRPEIEQVTPAHFETIYRNLLHQVTTETNATIVLMEPTVIEEDPASAGNRLLQPYVKIIRALSEEFHTVRIPLHKEFINILKRNPNTTLTTDGVHMTEDGRQFMANIWLNTVKQKLCLFK